MTKAIMQTILTIMLLLSAGIGARYFKILKKDDSLILNKVLVYMALPSLAFSAIHHANLAPSLMTIPLLAGAIMTGTGLLALFLASLFRLSKPLTGSLLLAGVLGNTAFIGYPIIISVFGKESLVKAVLYNEIGTVFFIFVIGSLVGAYYGEGKVSWREVLKNILTFPPLISLLLAFITKPLPLPKLFLDVLDYFSQLTIPLVMITVGLSLDIKQIKQGSLPLFLALFMKLIFSPIVALLLTTFLPLDNVTKGIVILEAAMPVSMVSISIALKYQLDTDYISGAIFASILASLLTLPLLGYFLPS